MSAARALGIALTGPGGAAARAWPRSRFIETTFITLEVRRATGESAQSVQ